MIEVSYLAVFAAALAAMALGALWYSPILFLKPWMSLMGITKDGMKSMKMTPLTAMVLGFIATLITSYVLAYFISMSGATDIASSVMLGFWVWLGFQAPLLAGSVLWEGKQPMLYIINTSHQFLATMLMAVILAVLM